MSNETLYDRVVGLINQNESLYDKWEWQISSRIAKKWPAAYELALNSGDDNPTVTIVVDLGGEAINDPEAFIDDLKEIFRYLSKGGRID